MLESEKIKIVFEQVKKIYRPEWRAEKWLDDYSSKIDLSKVESATTALAEFLRVDRERMSIYDRD